jgi:hypothetical protein
LVLLVVSNANACRIPSRTPANLSADMALGGSGHADTINSYPKGTACLADLRDYAVRLMKGRRVTWPAPRRGDVYGSDEAESMGQTLDTI